MHIGAQASSAESQLLGAVLARVGERDHGAFAELYAATAGRIFGMTMRVLCDHGYAEDVTQEVFAEVWTKARTYDARRGTPLAWMITLAHRRAIDRVRSEQARIDRDNRSALLAQRRVFEDDVSAAVLDDMSARSVGSLLDCLTALQREAIGLAYFDRLSYSETAAVLGVPVPTAKARIRGGLLRMRMCLEAELPAAS